MNKNNELKEKEILRKIKLLKEGKGTEEEIAQWFDNELKGLENIVDIIFYSKLELSPEEILKLAHEQNKPILI